MGIGENTEYRLNDDLFKDVRYFITGVVPDQVHSLLSKGGGKKEKHIEFMTHLITGNNPDENEISLAKEVYEKTAITHHWVLYSGKCGKQLPLEGFLHEENKIFSNVKASISNLSGEDSKSIWSLLSFYGGKFSLELDQSCTHLICGKPYGAKYEKAIEKGFHIVTPDWVNESVEGGERKEEFFYHPRLLNTTPPPAGYKSTEQKLENIKTQSDPPASESLPIEEFKVDPIEDELAKKMKEQSSLFTFGFSDEEEDFSSDRKSLLDQLKEANSWKDALLEPTSDSLPFSSSVLSPCGDLSLDAVVSFPSGTESLETPSLNSISSFSLSNTALPISGTSSSSVESNVSLVRANKLLDLTPTQHATCKTMAETLKSTIATTVSSNSDLVAKDAKISSNIAVEKSLSESLDETDLFDLSPPLLTTQPTDTQNAPVQSSGKPMSKLMGTTSPLSHSSSSPPISSSVSEVLNSLIQSTSSSSSPTTLQSTLACNFPVISTPSTSEIHQFDSTQSYSMSQPNVVTSVQAQNDIYTSSILNEAVQMATTLPEIASTPVLPPNQPSSAPESQMPVTSSTTSRPSSSMVSHVQTAALPAQPQPQQLPSPANSAPSHFQLVRPPTTASLPSPPISNQVVGSPHPVLMSPAVRSQNVSITSNMHPSVSGSVSQDLVTGEHITTDSTGALRLPLAVASQLKMKSIEEQRAIIRQLKDQKRHKAMTQQFKAIPQGVRYGSPSYQSPNGTPVHPPSPSASSSWVTSVQTRLRHGVPSPGPPPTFSQGQIKAQTTQISSSLATSAPHPPPTPSLSHSSSPLPLHSPQQPQPPHQQFVSLSRSNRVTVGSSGWQVKAHAVQPQAQSLTPILQSQQQKSLQQVSQLPQQSQMQMTSTQQTHSPQHVHHLQQAQQPSQQLQAQSPQQISQQNQFQPQPAPLLQHQSQMQQQLLTPPQQLQQVSQQQQPSQLTQQSLPQQQQTQPQLQQQQTQVSHHSPLHQQQIQRHPGHQVQQPQKIQPQVLQQQQQIQTIQTQIQQQSSSLHASQTQPSTQVSQTTQEQIKSQQIQQISNQLVQSTQQLQESQARAPILSQQVVQSPQQSQNQSVTPQGHQPSPQPRTQQIVVQRHLSQGQPQQSQHFQVQVHHLRQQFPHLSQQEAQQFFHSIPSHMREIQSRDSAGREEYLSQLDPRERHVVSAVADFYLRRQQHQILQRQQLQAQQAQQQIKIGAPSQSPTAWSHQQPQGKPQVNQLASVSPHARSLPSRGVTPGFSGQGTVVSPGQGSPHIVQGGQLTPQQLTPHGSPLASPHGHHSPIQRQEGPILPHPGLHASNVSQNLVNQSNLVNPKTKTALANLLTNRLSSSVHQGSVPQGSQGAMEIATHILQKSGSTDGVQGEQVVVYQRRPMGNITGTVTNNLRAAAPGSTGNQPHPMTGAVGGSSNYPRGGAAAHSGGGSPVIASASHYPRPLLYGHDINMLPRELCMVGCVFYIADYYAELLQEAISSWERIIQQHGGEVVYIYDASRVTHFLCKNQKSPLFPQAVRDNKRCITAEWINDILIRGKMAAPWQAIHLPTPFGNNDLPMKDMLVSMTGFENEERASIKSMITKAGAKYTGYFSRHNHVLICKRFEGPKINKAREYKRPVVNGAWLSDVLLGNNTPPLVFQSTRYQTNLEDPLTTDSSLSSHLLLNAWKYPITVSKELVEKAKAGREIALRKRKSEKEGDQENKKIRSEHLNMSNLPPTSSSAITLTASVPGTTAITTTSSLGGGSPTDSSFDDKSLLDAITSQTIKDEISECIKPKILLSSIKNKPEMEKKIKDLGGSIAKSVSEATHLVVGGSENSAPRTVKMVCAVSCCQHILTALWITESHLHSKFLPESYYTLKMQEFESLFHFNLQETLKKPNRRQLFSGRSFYLTPSVPPSRSGLKEIVEYAGGQVDAKRKSLAEIKERNRNGAFYICISVPKDFHLLQEILHEKMPVYNPEFILMSILRQQIDTDFANMTEEYHNEE